MNKWISLVVRIKYVKGYVVKNLHSSFLQNGK